MQTDQSRTWKQSPVASFVSGAVLFSGIDVAIPYVLEGLRAPLILNYGISIPQWILFVGAAIALALIYLRLGVAIVRSRVGEPLSQWAIVLQTVVGIPLLLALVYLIEFGMLLSIQTIHLGVLRPQWIIRYLAWTTHLDVVFGVWGGLMLYWIRHQSRSSGPHTQNPPRDRQ